MKSAAQPNFLGFPSVNWLVKGRSYHHGYAHRSSIGQITHRVLESGSGAVLLLLIIMIILFLLLHIIIIVVVICCYFSRATETKHCTHNRHILFHDLEGPGQGVGRLAPLRGRGRVHEGCGQATSP